MSEYIGDDYEEITRDQIPAGDLPTIAIVGRPNVGKSTLVNRIVGRRIAIVEEKPGVTRDRKEVVADWLGHFFVVVDTGGWISNNDALDTKVTKQAEQALEEADVVLFVVDVTAGVTGEDAQVADLIRRRKGPTLLIANKVDHSGLETQMWELLGLGVGEPHPVSAMHGNGVADVLDIIIGILPPIDEATMDTHATAVITDPDDAYLSISIVGRPNVGKSTLFNRMVGEDRAVVHDMPGTTRDSIDTIVETEMGEVRFVDTAGMRRKSRIDEDTEYYSMLRALKSIDKSDIALLVIDSTSGITHQDQRLAERIDGAGCPIVVVLNKWEMLDPEQRQNLDDAVERKLHFVGNSPILKMSALTGKGVHRLLPVLAETVSDYHRRVPTREVNRVIRAAQQATPAPAGARVLYATQGAVDPPTFTMFANRTLPATYLRYLERSLREAFDLGATPIKIRVRRRDD